jgi:FXSXX-COOH protein
MIMQDRGKGLDDTEVDGVLPEIGTVALVELLRSEDSALADAVRRLVREADRPEQSYAAFGSTP